MHDATTARTRTPPPVVSRRPAGLLVAVIGVAAALAAAVGYVAGRTSVPPAPKNLETRFVTVPVYERVPVAGPAAAARPERFSAAQRQERVAAQASEALDRVKPQLAARCWDGLPIRPSARNATVVLQVSFDADGHEVARGFLEERDDGSGVAECLRGVMDLPLAIPAPGAPADAQISLTLP